jgi:hypothetical protein
VINDIIVPDFRRFQAPRILDFFVTEEGGDRGSLIKIETTKMDSFDPVEKMVIHLTGKRSHELPKRNRSILKFPIKVRLTL